MRSNVERVLGSVLLMGLTVALAAGSAWAQSIDPEVMEGVKRATVMVKTSHSKNTKGDTPIGSGTGFFVNASGLCITNDHVIDPAHGKSQREKMEAFLKYNRLTWRVVVESGSDDEQTYEANVLYSNDQADMAVMQVYDEDGEFLSTPDYLRFHSTEEVALKSKLWNLGFPGGKSRRNSQDGNPKIAVQTGNVVALPRSPSGRVKGIVTNVLANQGNSGGPAVDEDGRLVGIVTLAGGGDESKTASSILIPADLTHQMIRIAFEERKIPGGVDITPFFGQLMDRAGLYRIPEIERSASATCVTMEDGAVLCGSPSDKVIAWPGPLGEIKIPSGLFAYYVTDSEDDEFGTVLLDGGDRFRIASEDLVFKFTPRGGSPMDIGLEDVKSIAFRLPPQAPRPPKGNAYVIGGDDFRLSIKNPKGHIKFTTTSDLSVDIPVGDVAAVETDDDQMWLYTTHGSKMSGTFAEHELTGVLAWSDTPISFTFASERLSNAGVKTVNYARSARRGEPPLAESISTSDSRLVKIATSLDAGSIGSEKSTLDELLQPDTYKRLSPQKKEEVRRLEGEQLFREGQFDSAAAVFKKLKNADVDDVRWHARTRLAMIERFDGGTFGGVKLSDHKAFDEAAQTLAGEQIREARRSLEELEAAVRSEPPKRTGYLKLVRRAKAVEESLLIANRLRGGTTEDLMVRLWRNLSYLHANEARRLAEEAKDLRERESQGGADARRRTDSQRRRIEQKLARFDTEIEKARKAFVELRVKIRDAGFIIDDSDRDLFEED